MPTDNRACRKEYMEIKEYLRKNPNEYNLNGKRYIEKIRRCAVKKQFGENFCLYCKIHQRGEHQYVYTPGTDFIAGYINDKKTLCLSDEALKSVTAAVREYKEKVADAKRWKSVKFSVEGIGFSVYYRQKSDDFIYFLEYADNGRTENLFYKDECLGNLHRLLYDLQRFLPGKKEGHIFSEKYNVTTSSDITENPIYAAALEQKDELFAALLRRYYGIADENECSFLSKLLGYRILPTLSENSDRNYIVTRRDVDYKLLIHSGYTVLHTPNFGMNGQTRDKITLNPHRKTGYDSAAADAAAITFREFLSLFDGERTADDAE